MIFFLVLFAIGLARGDQEADIQAILSQAPTCNSSKTIQCGRACGEYYICAYGPNPLSINRCPASAPFCNIDPTGDYCAIHRDLSRLTCQPLSFLFHCTGDGYFPDPTDCSAFYICVPAYGRWNAERRECPRNFMYDSNLRRCILVSSSTTCSTVSCETGNSTYLAYPGNSQYFYNCVERSINVLSGKIPVIHRCTSGTSGTPARFNEATQTCNPYLCSVGSRFVVQDNAREFYQCHNSRVFATKCPNSYRFDSSRNICVKV